MLSIASIALKAKAGISVAKAVAVANAPLGLFVGGLVVGVVAIVAVAKAAVASKDEITEAIDELEQVNDELKHSENLAPEDIAELKVEKKRSFRKVIRVFIKYFGKPIIFLTISGGLLVGGFIWQSRRFAIAAATAAAQATLIKTMETNIAKTYGDKAVIAMQDPNWDPTILQRSDNEETTLKGYADPYRNYSIGNGDPSRSLYLVNKFTMDPNKFRVPCVSPYSSDINVQDIVGRLLQIQGQANEVHKECEFYTEKELLQFIGFGLVGNYTLDTMKRLQNNGWGQADYIDFGIGDLVSELSKNCDDPTYMYYLNDKYRDGVPIKLNSHYINDTYSTYDLSRRAFA